MTKSTKFVAALGIAAGIGVAALPLGAFATKYVTTPYETEDQSADVTVQLKVAEGVGIAVDTSDATTSSDTDADKHTSHVFSDTDLVVNANLFAPKQHKSFGDAVSIGTNSADGMILTVKDKEDSTDLYNSAAASTTNRSIPMVEKIGDQSGNWVPGWNISAALPATDAGSGYIGGESAETPGTAAGFDNVVLSGQTAKTVYVGHEAEETDIDMTYDVATAVDQAAGVYQNVLTYTVSLNN